MNQNVKVVFDRRKRVETKGIGKIEIYIYLARKEKKYEVVGEGDVNTWESIALNKNIQAKILIVFECR